MANPFYIRKRRSPVLDIASLALQYQALKDRGALTKRGQDIQEKGQALKKEQFKKEWGEDVVTPGKWSGQIDATRHIPGMREKEFAQKGRRIAVGEQSNILAAQKEETKELGRIAQFNKNQQKPADRGMLLRMTKQYPAIAPMLNEIKGGLDLEEGQEGKLTTKSDVYARWKQWKATGRFNLARADLIKAADALLAKGDIAGAKAQRELANAIVKPGFLDDLYNVPESLRAPVKTKTAGKLYETEEGWKPRDEAIDLKKPEKKAGKPTDFETAYKQHVGIPGNEKITRLQFKKLWQPVKEKTEKLSDLKTIGEIEVAFMEYNDQEILGAYGSMYNRKNKQGKIAYWNENKENPGWFKGVGGIEIIKLPRDLIKQGWKPSTVQDTADLMNMSVEEFLTELEKDTKLKIINK